MRGGSHRSQHLLIQPDRHDFRNGPVELSLRCFGSSTLDVHAVSAPVLAVPASSSHSKRTRTYNSVDLAAIEGIRGLARCAPGCAARSPFAIQAASACATRRRRRHSRRRAAIWDRARVSSSSLSWSAWRWNEGN